MRDKNQLNPQILQKSIMNFIERGIPRRIVDLRNQIVDDPNFLKDFSNNLCFQSKRTQALHSLAFISWWLPPEIGVLIRLELQPLERLMNKKDKILLRIFLSSSEDAFQLVWLSRRWHSRDFFGNFLQDGLRELSLVRIRKESRKVRRPKRKRGYHDHGSRRPDSKWLPSFDWSFTLEQNLREREETYLDTFTTRVLRSVRAAKEREGEQRI